MADRSLRGSRLGATSYETDEGVDVAERQPVTYDCPNGHATTVPFSIEADVPDRWECRTCGAVAEKRARRGGRAEAGEACSHALGHVAGAPHGR